MPDIASRKSLLQVDRILSNFSFMAYLMIRIVSIPVLKNDILDADDRSRLVWSWSPRKRLQWRPVLMGLICEPERLPNSGHRPPWKRSLRPSRPNSRRPVPSPSGSHSSTPRQSKIRYRQPPSTFLKNHLRRPQLRLPPRQRPRRQIPHRRRRFDPDRLLELLSPLRPRRRPQRHPAPGRRRGTNPFPGLRARVPGFLQPRRVRLPFLLAGQLRRRC